MGQPSGIDEPTAAGQPSVVVPPIDVYETADEVLIHVDTPGFEEDEIELRADEQTLLVTAVREQEPEEGRSPLLLERPTHLERVVQIPPGADVEGAKATHDDGVCTVTIPKTESRRRRTIAFQ
ncbi:hsp20-type molecular chaperone [Salinarchaeum sp. Harcht-Bsk1]|nr:hsp20-type molecular chaperone [Salinarchaeum sp. Harcht-Bsk1]